MVTSDARELATLAMDDPGVFARALVGHELWDHQLDVARSVARYRMICAGRQVGKSRLLAILALWEAFRAPGRLILVVSAGESAAKRLLEDVASLAVAAPLLRGAVVDEDRGKVELTNGSTIRAVPASPRQIRGWPVDVLIVDEAAFVAQDVWQSAEPSIIARPGSRVILSSSPFGPADHFFRMLWRRGMDRPDEMYASWHWPSSTSPLVDQELLDQIRERETPAYFQREYLAEWTDGVGSYFTQAELDGAVEDYDLTGGGDLPQWPGGLDVSAGIDWGMRVDAHAMVCTGPVPAEHPLAAPGRMWVPFVVERFGMPYSEFIDLVVSIERADRWSGLRIGHIAAETNGVGQMPVEQLRKLVVGTPSGADDRRARIARLGGAVVAHRPRSTAVVEGVTTSARSKEDQFGAIRLLIQQGRLALPRHPSLLRQLAALEFVERESGTTSISVPEAGGLHDDVAMAFALSTTRLVAEARSWAGVASTRRAVDNRGRR